MDDFAEDFWAVKVSDGQVGEVVEIAARSGETKIVTLTNDFPTPNGQVWSFVNGSVDLVAEAQIKVEHEIARKARNLAASQARKVERTAAGFRNKKEEKLFYKLQREAEFQAYKLAKGN